MSNDRITRLEQLGVDWDPPASKWDEGFTALKNYKEAEGHCNVPLSYKTADGFAVGNWLVRQRSANNKGKLSND